MKKRITLTLLALVCVLSCVFGLTACGGDTKFKFKLLDDDTYMLVNYDEEVTDINITIPSTYEGKPVTVIGGNMFQNFGHIQSVTLPDSLTTIGSRAFQGTGLINVVLPDGVTTLNEGAFLQCSSLKSIVVPVSVKTIGNSAFFECTAFEAVYYKGTSSDWNKISVGYHNDCLSARYYYSETEPELGGNYWHYVNDTPTKW